MALRKQSLLDSQQLRDIHGRNSRWRVTLDYAGVTQDG